MIALIGKDGTKLSREAASELMRRSVQSEEERKAFAAALALPVRKEVETTSTVRRIFAVDVIEEGRSAEYPVDIPGAEAVVMPAQGAIPVNIFAHDYLTVPLYDYVTSVQYREEYAQQGRYDFAARALEKLKDAFVSMEETDGWNMVANGYATTVSISAGSPGAGSLSLELVNAALETFESNGYKPDLLVVNAAGKSDIREWSGLDDVTMRQIFQQAGLDELWGFEILTRRELSGKYAYMFDTSRWGVMPIRGDLDIRDDPTARSEFKVKLNAKETVGFAVLDKNACVRLSW